MKFTIAIVAILAAAGIVDAVALNAVTQLDAQSEAEFGFGGLADMAKARADEARKRVEEAKKKAEEVKKRAEEAKK